MKCLLTVFITFAVARSALCLDIADSCNDGKCTIAKNCRCSNSPSPLTGKLDDWPQLISLTFDDAITDDIYNKYLSPLLFNSKNPDNKPIGATFFVPHEYTNYQRVNDLYNSGFEIGVNSISKYFSQKYWRNATADLLVQEFSGQKHILTKFANIPESSILGVRTPQLQLAGDNSFQAYVKSKLTYDSSWPSLASRRMFPYTLDFMSTEECILGAKCPKNSYPGFWVLPINELSGENGKDCNVISSCTIEGSSKVISDWLTGQVEDIRNSTKIPLTLMIDSGWFNSTENSVDAFKQFMTNMSLKKDVFFVTQKQVYEWIRNPVKTANFKTETSTGPVANCDKKKCLVKKDDDQYTFFICTSCPNKYPWVGNPDGN
ncbi:unnamed protein product [Phyllotreta striolata]|uniref:NodB homology domain-containing protein n=1 Tax=Phyllotreta striolata TaxID=444603 RepID=A0A9N9XSX7_PHYSR|nr:unnamed protein product [Phyllotreta striolata]